MDITIKAKLNTDPNAVLFHMQHKCSIKGGTQLLCSS